MVDKVEEQVKGISFVLTKHDQSVTTDGKLIILQAELLGYAPVKEDELVQKVINKMLEGFRIYSENDFQAEIQELLRQELDKEVTAHAITKKALELEIANRMKVEERLRQFDALASRLGESLRSR